MKWFNFPVSPEPASSLASWHDPLFFFISALTAFFTLAVIAVLLFFVVRYRHGQKVDRSNPVHENVKLEIGWSLPPLVLGLGVFFWGATVFVQERVPPKDCYEVYVIGKQWMWHLQHPNGVRENNQLHIPVGRPIKVTMISQDVIHAFYIPEFRVQYYTVPGRYTSMWFDAVKPGTYHLFCNLYCGTQHSEMGGTITAMNPKEFTQWLQNGGEYGAPESAVSQGAKLYNRLACANCHGEVDGERGPTLVGIYGTKRTFADNTTAIADQAYIRESILDPWAKITKGYDQTMPAYKGQISEDDVLALSAYIKSLSTVGKPGSGMSDPQMGNDTVRQTSTYAPTRAVGAIGAREPVTAPSVKPGQMQVGALGARSGDAKRQ